MNVTPMHHAADIWLRAKLEKNWMVFTVYERSRGRKVGKFPSHPTAGVAYPSAPEAAARYTYMEAEARIATFTDPSNEDFRTYQDDRIVGYKVGYLARPGSLLTTGDLDNSRDPVTGAIMPWAAEVLTRGQTYCEVSTSGTGLRLVMQRMDGDDQHSSREENDCGFFADGKRGAILTFDPLPGYDVQPAPVPAVRDAILSRRGVGATSPKRDTSEIDGEVSPELIAALLDALPNDGPPNAEGKRGVSYDDWCDIAFAVIHSLGREVAWPLFDGWSRKAEKYDEAETAKAWRGFKPDGRLTMGKLWWMVKKAHGGKLPSSVDALMSARRVERHVSHIPTGTAWDDMPDLGDYSPTHAPMGAYKGKRTAAAFAAGYVPFDYLLDGVIQTGRVQALTAFTGHGKTTTALHLAIAIASGTSFAGHETLQGSVYFLAGENHDNTRVQYLAACHAQDIDPASLPIYWHEGPFAVGSDLQQVLNDVSDLPDLRLIVGDTHQAFFQGDSDNDNMQMLEAARQWRPLTQRIASRPTVLIPTHPSGKTADRSNLVPRGGGAFLNEIDGNLTCWKDDNLVRLHWQGKHRGPDFLPVTMELKLFEDSRVVDAKNRPLAVPVLIETSAGKIRDKEAVQQIAERAILEVLKEQAKITQEQLAAATSIHKSTVKRRLDDLLDHGQIKRLGKSVYKLTKKGEDYLLALQDGYTYRPNSSFGSEAENA
ncbi:DUF977 family protein [Falsiruegeria mediterranea]|uniref:DUF977 family protein n=1 Tax=Falsiruegeria mediterranea TaxID=1280832 RepID=UPI0015F2715C|nr:DUF977 family protein [Falsiruegeria mediterranea]